jgi:adenylate cyclase
VIQPSGSSATRRFLRRAGFALFSAALFGALFGGLLYFRVPRGSWEQQEGRLPLHKEARRLLESLELRTYDWRVRELGRASEPSRDVVVVALDDRTLDAAAASKDPGINAQPWPREILGGMVQEMILQGAKLVVVDLLFPHLSPRHCPSDLPATYGVQVQDSDDDVRFRELLDAHPGRSVLVFAVADESRAAMPPDGILKNIVLVEQVDTADQVAELVREVFTAGHPALAIPAGKRTQVWAIVHEPNAARSIARLQDRARAGNLVSRPRTNQESAYEVTAQDLLVWLSAVEVEGLDPARVRLRNALEFPTPRLLNRNSHYGAVAAWPDVDKLIRAVPHLHRVETREGPRLVPSAALAAAMQLAGTRALRYADGRLHVGDAFSFPMDEEGYSLVRWDKAESEYSEGSLATSLVGWRVLQRTRERYERRPVQKIHELDGKIVIFTNTSRYGQDRRATPISEVTPGGAVLGQALVNMMRSQGIVRVPPARDAAAALILAVVGALIALSSSGALQSFGRATLYLLSVAGVVGAYLWFSRWLFIEQGEWLAVAGPLFAMAGAFLLTTGHAFRSERRVRDFIFSALGSSVSPEVARRVAQDFSLIRPERREITVYFSDLEGFTRISEQMAPDQLIQLLEAYFGEMTRLVRETGGHLDKFIGDAVMALWNAPNPNASHPSLACESALRMRDALMKKQPEWEKRFGHRFVARAGLNTGEAVVGHVGSDLQAAYTAIGDSVNLASRLEGANKIYGTWILAGQTTWERARGDFVFREVDRVRVKGKTVPTRIFELMARKGDADARVALVPLFGQALEAYHRRAFEEALGLFSACASDFNDPASAVYVGRCRQYAAQPPPEDWDGVYELKEK